MSDLISVIVPIYNAEKTLDRCLQSIITQTYHNLEIILVNDGSVDASLDICNTFAENDARITVITSINQGVSKARNLGMDTATGSYYGFIDSDDWVEPHFFETLHTGMKLNDNTCLSVIGISTDGWKQYLAGLCGNQKHCSLSFEKALDEITKEEGLRGYLCNKLFQRTNYRLIESISVCEDLEYTVRYLHQYSSLGSSYVTVCNACSYHYSRDIISPTHQYNRYGFVRFQTAFLAYESMLRTIPEEFGYLHTRIKLAILKLSYRLLIDWYSIPTKEKNNNTYTEQKISVIQDYFKQYYYHAKTEKDLVWRCKFMLMRRFPILFKKLLVLKRKTSSV